jgi:large subunit ribosomal protein L20
VAEVRRGSSSRRRAQPHDLQPQLSSLSLSVCLLLPVSARNCIRIARGRYEKSLLHAYVGRKLKSRSFRSLWISRINAGSRLYSLPYGRLVSGLAQLDVRLNRKMLSELAAREPFTFRSIVEQVKEITRPPLCDFPSHGLVQSELVVNVRRQRSSEEGGDVWRVEQANNTRRFLESWYGRELHQRREDSSRQQPVTAGGGSRPQQQPQAQVQ